MATNNALAKLTIIPYTSDKFDTLAGTAFVAMYNPSTLSTSHTQDVQEMKTANGSDNSTQDKNKQNPTVSVELLLDGTGASPPQNVLATESNTSVQGFSTAISGLENGKVNISKAIEILFKVLMKIESKTHDSNFLKVIWGEGLYLECKVQSATVNYSLFNRDGSPLRATVSCTFIETNNHVMSQRKNKLFSPDITKIHLVKAGDTIYNIAKSEYGSESFYLQIAAANDLMNYRKLQPGQNLILPPTNKAE
ncbi:MAG: LysM peptidoglycan-binding domain-containing protein [Bacteroidetes bacterium]|nr:LysM peptidoglycan-binding domain-containing protein [Bacteroidota bacterium]